MAGLPNNAIGNSAATGFQVDEAVIDIHEEDNSLNEEAVGNYFTEDNSNDILLGIPQLNKSIDLLTAQLMAFVNKNKVG